MSTINIKTPGTHRLYGKRFRWMTVFVPCMIYYNNVLIVTDQSVVLNPYKVHEIGDIYVYTSGVAVLNGNYVAIKKGTSLFVQARYICVEIDTNILQIGKCECLSLYGSIAANYNHVKNITLYKHIILHPKSKITNLSLIYPSSEICIDDLPETVTDLSIRLKSKYPTITGSRNIKKINILLDDWAQVLTIGPKIENLVIETQNESTDSITVRANVDLITFICDDYISHPDSLILKGFKELDNAGRYSEHDPITNYPTYCGANTECKSFCKTSNLRINFQHYQFTQFLDLPNPQVVVYDYCGYIIWCRL